MSHNKLAYLSTIAINGDTANDDDAAAAISMPKSLTRVVNDSDFSVAIDSNGCWDKLEWAMAIWEGRVSDKKKKQCCLLFFARRCRGVYRGGLYGRAQDHRRQHTFRALLDVRIALLRIGIFSFLFYLPCCIVSQRS